MKQNGRTINSYFIFIILLVMVIVGLNLLSNREEDYTRAEFIADLDAGNVSEIVIQPNGEAPTGYLEIQMKNGLNHKLYATDITELETLVREYGFDPVVNDIERENWFLTYMLPMLAVLAVGVFLFMMMNAQQAGGGNGKMMNFGKSRAKMSMGDKSVTFAQVAGLKEEKRGTGGNRRFSERTREIHRRRCEDSQGCSVGGDLPEPVRLCWRKPWQAKPEYLFSAFPDLISWKCSSVSAHPVCAICLKRRSTMRPVSCSSMRSMPWQDAVVPVWAADTMRESRP